LNKYDISWKFFVEYLCKAPQRGATNLGICFLSLFAISDGIPQKKLKNHNILTVTPDLKDGAIDFQIIKIKISHIYS